MHSPLMLKLSKRYNVLKMSSNSEETISITSYKEKQRKNIVKRLLSETNDTYLQFDGANEILVITSTDDSLQKKSYVPQILDDSVGKIWEIWKNKKYIETALKGAIKNNVTNIQQYFDQLQPYMAIDKADVLQANSDFFTSIANGDLSLMKSVWLKSNSSLYIQSNTNEVIKGYDNIIKSLSQILLLSTVKSIDLCDINMYFHGDIAIVTCIVDMSSSFNGNSKSIRNKKLNRKYCTNIFVKETQSDRYSLVTHLSSNNPSLSNSELAATRETYQDPSRISKRRGKNAGPISIQQLLGGGFGAIIRNSNNNNNNEDNDYDDDDDNDYDDDDDDDDDDDMDDDEYDDIVVENYDENDDNGNKSKINKAGKSDVLNERMRDTIRKTMMKLINQNNAKTGGSGSPNKFFIINSKLDNDNLKKKKSLKSKKLKRLFVDSGNDDNDDDNDDDEDNDDDDDDDDDDQEAAKELAARTLTTIQWLCDHDKLSKEEKHILTLDVVQNVGNGKFSRAEVAYSLIIGGGRPGEEKISDSQIPFDVTTIDSRDLSEFEDVCHILANS